MPAVLIEVGFISSEEEALLLNDPKHLEALAEVIDKVLGAQSWEEGTSTAKTQVLADIYSQCPGDLLLDFSKLTGETVGQTEVDFSDMADYYGLSAEDKPLMKTDLSIENWRIFIPPASRELAYKFPSYLAPAVVKESSPVFAENEELLADFFSEAQLQVEMLESNILVLEGDPKSKDAIDEIFRAAHTLKGGSATVQMTELAHFTHLVEDVFDLIRSDKLLVDDRIIDALLRSVDVIKSMLEERMAGSVFSQDISTLVEELKAILKQQNSTKGVASFAEKRSTTSSLEELSLSQVDQAETTNQQMGEYELLELQELAKGQEIYKIYATFDVQDPMASVGGVQVYSAIKNLGNVLRCYPSIEELMGDEAYKQVVYYATFNELNDCQEIAFKLELGGVIEAIKVETFHSLTLNQNSSGVKLGEMTLNQEEWQELSEATSKDQELYKVTAYIDASDPMASVGGVQMFSLLKRLGTILLTKPSFETLMGEEIFEHAYYYVHFNDFSDPQSMLEKISPGGVVTHVELEKVDLSKELSTRSTGDTEEVHRVCSREFANEESASHDTKRNPTQSKKPSSVLASSSSSQIIRIDNRRIDHLLNLVSETVINKAALNQISLKLTEMRDFFARIEERYTEKIEQLGDYLPQAIQDQGLENWNLIKNKIGEETELDKSVIDELSDPIMHCVRNSMDHGIELPQEREKAGKSEEGNILLKASNEGNQIIIEIIDDESHRISKSQVKVIDGFEMFDLHSKVISLIRLSDIFKISVVDDRDFYFVIVVGTAERAIGLVVDHLIGEEDLVIKPLKDHYTQTTGIAGAALLGDGQVALILDVVKLIDLGMQVGDSLRK
ncbi:UNVERIFIED_CONTAM: hypothetical protein PYX00_010817 [Menopon gallinae]|uniref:histidine kinase n=1 Tax=Menopon gallinae TaxID=328185 RepID=A0AAW2H706_9NEOP